MDNREIEAKFLNVDKSKLIEALRKLGAEDLGEEKLTQEIFRDKEGKWKNEGKFARIRKTKKVTLFTYKHVENRTATGTVEIEFEISEPEKLKAFLEAMNLELVHESEKLRHKFKLGSVVIDIDTWPKVPTYVEFEGPDEESIMKTSQSLGFDWSKAIFGTYDMVIEENYGIKVKDLRYFTFDKVE